MLFFVLITNKDIAIRKRSPIKGFLRISDETIIMNFGHLLHDLKDRKTGGEPSKVYSGHNLNYILRRCK
jgi:hypothetical protein